MTTKKQVPKWIACSALLLLGLLLISCVAPWPIQALYSVAVGWGYFLARVGPKITFDVSGILTGVFALAGFAFGLHMLLLWFYARSGQTDSDQRRFWRPKWTFCLTLLVAVMFASGIAVIGMVHQIGWIITSPEPLFDRSAGPARSKSSNNLKQIALGLHLFNDDHLISEKEGQLPPGYTLDKFGNLLHGWQAAILPYIEEDQLAKKIHFDLPWDVAANKAAMGTELRVFQNPFLHSPMTENGYALSHYAGNNHVLPANRGLRIPTDFKDGISNTIFLGEASAGFRPWGHPLNLRDPGRGIARSSDSFAGPWTNGTTLFAFVDGSVRLIKPEISPSVLRALATPAAGDDPGTDWDK